MKLRRVTVARYVGDEQRTNFTDATHEIDLDTALRMVRITRKSNGEEMLIGVEGCDCYPAEERVPT